MRLTAVKLEGFGRFKDSVTIDVAPSVVALVGPNEAGKSTILSAMLSTNDIEPFTRREKTRGDVSNETSVECIYVLDQDDIDAISHLDGGANVRWWRFIKKNGKHLFWLNPPPTRDLSKRHELASRLRKLAATEPLERLDDEGELVTESTVDEDKLDWLGELAHEALSSVDETLANDATAAIRRFSRAVRNVGTKAHIIETEDEVAIIELSEELRALADELVNYDEGDTPRNLAGRILIGRRPRFISFTADDRDLQTSYDLKEAAEDPPSSLANLLALADLNVGEIRVAINQNNPSRRVDLLEKANEKLRRVFANSWNQAPLTVHLDVHGDRLVLLVRSPRAETSEFGERSEGLRWFVALLAFVARSHHEVPPILLFDEAEMHLHYDAQADLVTLFTNQQLAAKVVYTTHSAGCLPRDLGNSIRVVVPLEQPERSTVNTSVWIGEHIGFTPIVFAMGATMFTFLPARFGLIGEGPTDAMLYPTLFREVKDLEALPFQVAPGLAAAAPIRMGELASHGGSIAFIADGDKDGRKYQQQLVQGGVQEKLVFGLDKLLGGDFELEDLILPDHYAAAVNHVLEVWQQVAAVYPADNLPEVGRPAAVKRWCAKRGITPPDKRHVAQRLLDMKAEAEREGAQFQLIDPKWKRQVSTLYDSIDDALKVQGSSTRPRIASCLDYDQGTYIRRYDVKNGRLVTMAPSHSVSQLSVIKPT